MCPFTATLVYKSMLVLLVLVHVAVVYFLFIICICVLAILLTILVQYLQLRSETKPYAAMHVSTDNCARRI